jgi:hypothetical protein
MCKSMSIMSISINLTWSIHNIISSYLYTYANRQLYNFTLGSLRIYYSSLRLFLFFTSESGHRFASTLLLVGIRVMLCGVVLGGGKGGE